MIKLNDLAIGYNGEAILEHIDQEFDDGLIYGLLAKSGAGRRPSSKPSLAFFTLFMVRLSLMALPIGTPTRTLCT